jgi:hypothetical protein
MDDYPFKLDPEEVIRLGTAIQNSSHVTNVTLDVTRIPCVTACSTLVNYLSSSSRLETVRFLGSLDVGPHGTGEEAKIATLTANLLFLAAQRNPSVRNLEINVTGSINQALHHLVHNPTDFSSSNLRSIKLVNSGFQTISSMLIGNDIPNFVTFVEHYGNHIGSLALDGNFICEEGTIALANVLSTNRSLVELSLNDCGVNAAGVCSIFAALPQNQTLKFLSLQNVYIDLSPMDDLEEFMDDSGDLCTTLVEYLPQCQLEKLELSRSIPVQDYFFGILHDQDALLGAFYANKTLKEVNICGRILDESRQPELAICTLRNIFQPYIACNFINSIRSSLSSLDDNRTSGKYPSYVSSIPLGLWPFLLEIAHQRYPNASLLHSMVSSRLDLLMTDA